MKILALADLHTFKIDKLQIIKNLNIDIITLLGDICESYLANIEKLFQDVNIVGVLGNHDLSHMFQKYTYIRNINGQVIDVGGIKIGGIEGSFKYKENCCFPSMTQTESLILSHQMERADILISHTSPYKVHEQDSDVHSGLIGINTYIENRKPILNLHGHQHENIRTLYNNTTIIGVYGAVLVDTNYCSSDIIFED